MPNEIKITEGDKNIIIQNAQSGRDIIINKTPEEIVKFLSENNDLQKEYIELLKEIRDGVVKKEEEENNTPNKKQMTNSELTTFLQNHFKLKSDLNTFVINYVIDDYHNFNYDEFKKEEDINECISLLVLFFRNDKNFLVKAVEDYKNIGGKKKSDINKEKILNINEEKHENTEDNKKEESRNNDDNNTKDEKKVNKEEIPQEEDANKKEQKKETKNVFIEKTGVLFPLLNTIDYLLKLLKFKEDSEVRTTLKPVITTVVIILLGLIAAIFANLINFDIYKFVGFFVGVPILLLISSWIVSLFTLNIKTQQTLGLLFIISLFFVGLLYLTYEKRQVVYNLIDEINSQFYDKPTNENDSLSNVHIDSNLIEIPDIVEENNDSNSEFVPDTTNKVEYITLKIQLNPYSDDYSIAYRTIEVFGKTGKTDSIGCLKIKNIPKDSIEKDELVKINVDGEKYETKIFGNEIDLQINN